MIYRLEGRSLLTVDLTMLPPPTPTAGQDFTAELGTFAFTDGSIGDYIATIDWGDGTINTGVITRNDDGSGTISGEHTYTDSADEDIAVDVNNGTDGCEGATLVSVGSGSGSGSGSGGGYMPPGLAQDLNIINQNGSPSIDETLLPWADLVVNGGTPWDDLRPYSMVSQEPTTITSTTTTDGVTTTETAASSATATSSGSEMSSGGSGGVWDMYYESHYSTRSASTGTNSLGQTVDDTSTYAYDLTWHAWGDGDGETHHKVTEDVTSSGDDDTIQSSNSDHQNSNDGHLMAEGVVDSNNNLISGDFTYDGDVAVQFSLTDASGTPTGGTPGYSVNYLASEGMKLNDSGSLIPDSTNQGTTTVTEIQNGQVAGFDGTGGSASIGFVKSVQVIDIYQASKPPAGLDNNPPPPPPITISASGPLTLVPTGDGRNTVYVIDTASPSHAQDPTGVNGQQIKDALRPDANELVDARNVNMAVEGLKLATGSKGKADVLVIGDHGLVTGSAPNYTPTGFQKCGTDRLDPNKPALLNQIAGFVKKKGTLVLTGCNLFDSNTVRAWQQYATDNDITIVGSASLVHYQKTNGCTGVWVTLKPGGTAPTITP